MRFRIVRVELRDEDVLLFMKRIDRAEVSQKFDLRTPEQILEFSLQMGMSIAKRLEEFFGFDAFVTLKYDEYITKELKVGDYVDIEIKEVD